MLNEYEICDKCKLKECNEELLGCLLRRAREAEKSRLAIEKAEFAEKGLKRCSRCKEPKPVTEFYRRGKVWAPACKECTRRARGTKYTRLSRIIVDGEPRKCRICGQVKPAAEFYWKADRKKWCSECRECTKKQIKERLQCLNANTVRG